MDNFTKPKKLTNAEQAAMASLYREIDEMCRRQELPAAIAEDLAHDAVLRLRSKPLPADPRKRAGYIATTVNHLIADRMQHRSREVALEEQDIPRQESVGVDHLEWGRALRDADGDEAVAVVSIFAGRDELRGRDPAVVLTKMRALFATHENDKLAAVEEFAAWLKVGRTAKEQALWGSAQRAAVRARCVQDLGWWTPSIEAEIQKLMEWDASDDVARVQNELYSVLARSILLAGTQECRTTGRADFTYWVGKHLFPFFKQHQRYMELAAVRAPPALPELDLARLVAILARHPSLCRRGPGPKGEPLSVDEITRIALLVLPYPERKGEMKPGRVISEMRKRVVQVVAVQRTRQQRVASQAAA
jgi:DNA-directed RNA polymerase specialized sigma24 family protein